MERAEAIEYVGHHIDNALSPEPKPITDETTLVGWQCGFEPMFVAVHNYLGGKVDAEEAVELSEDYLSEIGWFSGEVTGPAYIM